MGQITIALNGRSYRLACGDGEETRLTELAAYVSQRVSELANEFSQVGDDRLIVMAALMITDELFDAREALQQLPPGAIRPHNDRMHQAGFGSPGDFFATPLPETDAANPGGAADEVEMASANLSAPPRTPIARRDTRRSDGRASLEERLAEARNKAHAHVRLADRK